MSEHRLARTRSAYVCVLCGAWWPNGRVCPECLGGIAITALVLGAVMVMAWVLTI